MEALFAFDDYVDRERGGHAIAGLLGIAALPSFVVALIWIYMAGAYYFTNVGATLGIHLAAAGPARIVGL